mmetsp:Transcript_16765/g.31376  ORF Transcript_16765/g.31376 Transcript_16765/m.31376 type:complete len:255 (-) Transcript_16765:1651-2415(-)
MIQIDPLEDALHRFVVHVRVDQAERLLQLQKADGAAVGRIRREEDLAEPLDVLPVHRLRHRHQDSLFQHPVLAEAIDVFHAYYARHLGLLHPGPPLEGDCPLEGNAPLVDIFLFESGNPGALHVPERRFGRPPIRGMALQAATDEFLGVRRDSPPPPRYAEGVLGPDEAVQLVLVLQVVLVPYERCVPGEKDPGDDADGPNVGLFRVLAEAARNFGRERVRRADGPAALLGAIESTGEAEVDESYRRVLAPVFV